MYYAKTKMHYTLYIIHTYEKTKQTKFNSQVVEGQTFKTGHENWRAKK